MFVVLTFCSNYKIALNNTLEMWAQCIYINKRIKCFDYKLYIKYMLKV